MQEPCNAIPFHSQYHAWCRALAEQSVTTAPGVFTDEYETMLSGEVISLETAESHEEWRQQVIDLLAPLLARAHAQGHAEGRASVLGELEPELPATARCCLCDVVRDSAPGWETRRSDDGSAACLLCPDCAPHVPPDRGSAAEPPASAASPVSQLGPESTNAQEEHASTRRACMSGELR